MTNDEPILWLIEAQNRHIRNVEKSLKDIEGSLKRIVELLECNHPSPAPPPQAPFAIMTGEHLGGENMNDSIMYDVNLPALAEPSDVVSRELTVIIGDDHTVHIAGKADTVIPGLSAPQDSHVRLELVDIDDKGNRSEPAVYEFDALDTFPPPKPGDFGVVITGEDVTPSPTP